MHRDIRMWGCAQTPLQHICTSPLPKTANVQTTRQLRITVTRFPKDQNQRSRHGYLHHVCFFTFCSQHDIFDIVGDLFQKVNKIWAIVYFYITAEEVPVVLDSLTFCYIPVFPDDLFMLSYNLTNYSFRCITFANFSVLSIFLMSIL